MMTAAGQAERAYVGRFSIAIPAGMRREGGTYEMRLLTLSDVALAPPNEAGWKATWAARLAKVEALKSERLTPQDVEGEVLATGELEPLFAFVVYHRDVKEAAQLDALRLVDGVGLWLQRPFDTELLPAVRARALAVGRAYQRRRPDGPPPAARPEAFHLVFGAILLPYQEQESARAHFKSGPPYLEIDLTTETVVEVKHPGLFERFGRAVVNAGAASTAGMSTVRSGKRRVGDLAGEEFILRDTEGGALRFLWEYPGEANSGVRPKIQLQLVAPSADEKEQMALWEVLLSSLKPAAQSVDGR
jgi:hypothetical protein